MKAYQLEAFGVENLRAVEREPPQAGPGQVVVAMQAASLNYRDLMVVEGRYNPRLKLPLVPLSDGAGKVVEVGPGVEELRVGDLVTPCFAQGWLDGRPERATARRALGEAVDGVLVERAVFPETGVLKAPPGLSAEEAATLPCAALAAWNGLFEDGRFVPGERVLVLGTGGVATFATQLAQAAGARVFVTSRSEAKLTHARVLGAAETIHTEPHPDWEQEVLRRTDGLGVDRVIELGGGGTLGRSLKAVRYGGTIALIGALAGGGQVDPVPVFMKGVTLRGVFVGSRAMAARLYRFVAARELRPVIDRSFRVAEVADALQALARGAHVGKLTLRW